MAFATIDEALDEIRAGRLVVVVDDEDRENEGDLTMAAELVTPEAIAFMATHGRGLICLSMTEERLDELKIPLMVQDNTTRFQTAFCVSIEAKVGTTTGISAADRAATILAAVHPETRPEDLARPGHVFPLRAVRGGVLRRAGQTEAAVDLARLAGLRPAGVICEVMKDDGTMARVPDLQQFCARHGLKMISIADLIRYRMQNERLVRRVASAPLVNDLGEFTVHAFENDLDGHLDIAVVAGEIDPERPTLVRVHTESLATDVFGAAPDPLAPPLAAALAAIAEEGGVVVYLRQEGRGRALLEQLERMAGRREGAGAERRVRPQREYGIGAQILVDLGVRAMRLLTNNPRAFVALGGYGLQVVDHVPLAPRPGFPFRAPR